MALVALSSAYADPPGQLTFVAASDQIISAQSAVLAIDEVPATDPSDACALKRAVRNTRMRWSGRYKGNASVVSWTGKLQLRHLRR